MLTITASHTSPRRLVSGRYRYRSKRAAKRRRCPCPGVQVRTGQSAEHRLSGVGDPGNAIASANAQLARLRSQIL
jgi:hypothetical protein